MDNTRNVHYLTRDSVRIITFPDGQPHIAGFEVPMNTDESVSLVWRIRNPKELFELLAVANALDSMYVRKFQLTILYLMGARSDRHMQHGDSCDLRVVADIVNLCKFERVRLFDVHSDVALQLIDHASNIHNWLLLKQYTRYEHNTHNSVLILPDAGSVKRADEYMKNCHVITDTVTCTKVRDLATGSIRLRVLEAARCKDRDCVIIDDLCDGGATFVSIAEQLEESNNKPYSLTLIVSHGIFSRGFSTLEKYFQRIIVSDSFSNEYDSEIVELVSLPFV
jgi:ribose-phosphate pyrophosphokinase